MIVNQQLVEEERRKAEVKLQRRIDKMKAQQSPDGRTGSLQNDGATTQPGISSTSTRTPQKLY